MEWENLYREKLMTPEQAAQLIESGDRIFVGGSGGLPAAVVNAVCERPELRNVQIISAVNSTEFDCLTNPECLARVTHHSMFIGRVDRKYQTLDTVHANSVQLHQALRAAREVYRVNTLMVEVSEPDEEGYLYYGSRGVAWGALDESVEKKIFQINSHQQRARGCHNRIHVRDVTALCRADHEFPIYQYKVPAEVDKRIAEHVVPRIHDGDTLQVGIGGIPNAVAYDLSGRKNLGIYTEVLTQAQLHLMQVGAVNLDRVEAGFVLGTSGHVDEKLLEHIYLLPLDQINDPYRAGRQPNLVSINACLMTDLTGQICSEAVNGRQYSGVGGQVDFVRAAARSPGGRSFLCLHSTYTAQDGTVSSNIRAQLPAGAVVTTPRTDVMYVVTEWGVADLFNRPLEDRICAMINIAHPDFRRALAEEAVALGQLRNVRAQKDIHYGVS